MCVGGKGEVQVTSIETHGQPDAGWLAATTFVFRNDFVYKTHSYKDRFVSKKRRWKQ